MSGIGKGITSSGLGCVLRNSGHLVTHLKIDPYLNADAGLLGPREHGEVFVLQDGGEVDLDFGTYERFAGIRLTHQHSLTSGKLYRTLLDKERAGDYGGDTVQVMRQGVDIVAAWVKDMATVRVERAGSPEVALLEIGGTVGEPENAVFMAALRRLRREMEVVIVHVIYAIRLGDEIKTKPAQQALQALQSEGLQPNVVIVRGKTFMDGEPEMVARKLDCGSAVMCLPDERDIYQVPLKLLPLYPLLCSWLKLPETPLTSLHAWVADASCNPDDTPVRIGLVGKYTNNTDAYLSVIHALRHAGSTMKSRVMVTFVDPEEESGLHWLQTEAHGILVPGGFGTRGFEGAVSACAIARTRGIPFLGICLGMQTAVVEFARSRMGLSYACSEEVVDGGSHAGSSREEVDGVRRGEAVIVKRTDGAMQLGTHRTLLRRESRLALSVGATSELWRRHRHRYEVDVSRIEKFAAHDLVTTGMGTDGAVHAIELPSHPFFLGVQYHPEFDSAPGRPVGEFASFVAAAMARVR